MLQFNWSVSTTICHHSVNYSVGKDYTKEAKSNKDDDDALQILLDEIKSQKKADPGSRPARNRRNNGEVCLSNILSLC